MTRIITAAALIACAVICRAATINDTTPDNSGINNHDHSACVDDSINPQKEAILSEITVQGLTGTQRIKDASSPFTVIAPKQLRDMSGTNIVDVISRTPGLAQISTGTGIAKPVIRGLGFNRVVVVEQGIRQEGQQWGDEHGLEVDGEGVHSVEILKGPASLMYGSDAIAGVMILHPEHSLPENTMQVKTGGEYQSNTNLGKYLLGFAGNAVAGKATNLLWNWHYTGKSAQDYENRHDGKVGNSWFDEHSLQGMLGIEGKWGHSMMRLSNVNFKPGIVGEEDAYQRVIHTKVVNNSMWNIGEGKLKTIIGYQCNFRREYEEDEVALAMKLHTVNYDVKYDFAPLWEGMRMSYGIGGMWQQNVNEGEETLIPDYKLFDFGTFLTATQQLNKWHLSGGIRFDNRNLSELDREGTRLPGKSLSAVTGSIGAVYNINERMNIRLNTARGFRAPTVSEMYSDGVHEGSVQYEIGNTSLNPEHSWQTDLGFDYTSHIFSIQASLFYNRIDNYIFLTRLADVVTDGYDTYQYVQGDASLAGGELSVDVHPTQALHIQNSFCFVSGRKLHNSNDDDRWLPMMPPARWNCDIRYNFKDFAGGLCRRSFICANMEYNLRQNHYYAVDDTETATADYALFNLSAGMDLHLFGHNCIELSVCCQNLFNKVYQSHLSRLKYVDAPDGHGYHAMGRNFCIKAYMPIDIHF